MEYLVGVDVGTTGTKAILFDHQGKMISSAYEGYGLISKKSGYAEQNPEHWYQAVVHTVRICTEGIEKDRVAALSISAQGGTMVALDQSGKSLGNAISWLDRRAAKEADELCKSQESDYFYWNTGWRLNDGYNLAQIKWMKTNEPELFCAADQFLSPLSYLNYRLTKKAVTDYTNEAITNLENIHTWSWDKVVYEELELKDSRLPEIRPSGTKIGALTEKAAEDMGLSDKTMVINGGYDQYCAALGLGAVEQGDLMLSTGTAWVLMAITDQLRFDTKSYISPCRHIIPGKFGGMASLETGGVSLDWFKNKIISGVGYKESYEVINAEIEKRGPGAGGVLFYPHFAGTTCPTWLKDNKGSFLGLTLFHDKYHMARAVMEGVVYEMCMIVDAYKKAGIEIKKIRLAGGASKSLAWTQMIADVTQIPVIVYENADAAAIGAGMIAAVGSGICVDFEDAVEKFRTQGMEIVPDPERIEAYQEHYIRYQEWFRELRKFYRRKGNETDMSEA